MIESGDLKKGVKIELDGEPYVYNGVRTVRSNIYEN